MILNDKSLKIFKSKYAIHPEESWLDASVRVANHIASIEDDYNTWANKFFDIIYEQYFIPGGRILANSGTNIYNLMNCFVLPIEDSRESIYGTLKDAAEVFAHGGGVGYNFSNVREEGATIKSTGGEASGPLSFMSLFDQTGEVIQQASRRGAQMGILNIDHPDIEKFIKFKSDLNKRNKRIISEFDKTLSTYTVFFNQLRLYGEMLEKVLKDDQLTHFNISVGLTDDFMKAVESNSYFNLVPSKYFNKEKPTLLARNLLNLIAEKAWESGDPGVFFIDRVNRDNMVPYMGKLESTNPCVTGDTKILTVYDGPKTFKELADEGDDVLVYTWNPETKLPEVSIMFNPRLTRKNVPTLKIEFDSGLVVKCTLDHSFYSFRGEKIKAEDLIVGQSIRAYSISDHRGHLRIHGWTDGKAQHKYVARMVWEYFNGPIEEGIVLHHKDLNKKNNRLENFELLRNDEHSQIHYNERRSKGFIFQNHKVVKITNGELEDVYNGTVDKTHTYIIADDVPISGIYSGIISANCGEVPLLPYESCCLGSINLHKFYLEYNNSINFELLEQVVRTAVRFLDNVQTISNAPLENINTMSKGLRRLGLGVMGWADLLAELGFPYDSTEAFNLANYLSWFITYFALLESVNLSIEKGSFDFYDWNKINTSFLEKVLNDKKFPPKNLDLNEVIKLGFRNVAVTSIAPTGTISLLANVNSGIEPFFALAYRRNITEGIGNVAKDYLIEVNPIL
ncbi:MAG: hypothetical protein BV456_11155, partial [Thermoplasmata archaeon M8B2D]